MRTSKLVKYYSQQGFRDFMLDFSNNREVVPQFRGRFGSRPQTFRFDSELLNTIRRGASSFHFSEERWTNPMTLSTEMKDEELNNLRAGWDLVFDVDSRVLDYSKICTKLVIDALDFHDVKEVSVKYSGGSGFHVGVSFNKPSMIEGVPVKNLFPKAPRIIGLYVQEMIKDYLKEMLLEKESIKVIAERTGLELSDDFDPIKVVSIDPVAIAPRHLIRAPYSLNEKKWYVSLPISPRRILEFNKEEAKPEKVSFDRGFLDHSCDASELIVQAFDWYKRRERDKKVKKHFKKSVPKNAVAYKMFPPCVHNILSGLSDGRKRALFILINFYHQCGYSWEVIEELLREWNSKNEHLLRSSYLKSQLEWAKRQGGLMPPNCSNPNYKDIGVCQPDNYCSKIKNPVTYALRKNKTMKPRKKSKGGG